MDIEVIIGLLIAARRTQIQEEAAEFCKQALEIAVKKRGPHDPIVESIENELSRHTPSNTANKYEQA